MVSTISSGINLYICPENSNAQQMQRGAACEKPDFVNTMYTTQELKDMMDQAMEERRRTDPEIREHSIYNWANWFNQHHPDLAGKKCIYVNGAWRTAEEVQEMEIKEFEKWQAELRKSKQNA